MKSKTYQKLAREVTPLGNPLSRRRPLFASQLTHGPAPDVPCSHQRGKTSNRSSSAGSTGGARSNDGGACRVSNIRGREGVGHTPRDLGVVAYEGYKIIGNRRCIPGNETVFDPSIPSCVPVNESSPACGGASPSIKMVAAGSTPHAAFSSVEGPYTNNG